MLMRERTFLTEKCLGPRLPQSILLILEIKTYC